MTRPREALQRWAWAAGSASLSRSRSRLLSPCHLQNEACLFRELDAEAVGNEVEVDKETDVIAVSDAEAVTVEVGDDAADRDVVGEELFVAPGLADSDEWGV